MLRPQRGFRRENLNYRIVVARDLVSGTDPPLEDAALKIVSLPLGLVMDAKDLLAEWRAPAQPKCAIAQVAPL